MQSMAGKYGLRAEPDNSPELLTLLTKIPIQEATDKAKKNTTPQ